MSNGTGPIGGLAVMGVAYWLAYGVAVVALASILVAIGAVLALMVIGLYAFGAWQRLYRQALERGDRDWLFDLLAAPLFGGFVAVVTYVVLSAAGLGEYLNGVQFHQSSSYGMAGWFQTGLWLVPMVTAFFGGIFGTAWAISQEKPWRRLLAYPGFAFYSMYAALLAWHIANPADDLDSYAVTLFLRSLTQQQIS